MNNCETMKLIILYSCLFQLIVSQTLKCDPGFTMVLDKCLQIFSEPQNHTFAENKCRSNGGTLVIIQNAIVSFKGFQSLLRL